MDSSEEVMYVVLFMDHESTNHMFFDADQELPALAFHDGVKACGHRVEIASFSKSGAGEIRTLIEVGLLDVKTVKTHNLASGKLPGHDASCAQEY